MMKKVIYRLTESDLHNMIRNTVNKILKEDFVPQITNSFDYKSDILGGKIYGVNASCNDSEVELEAVGKSGTQYYIIATISCSLERGSMTYDYYEPDEGNVSITSLQISKFDEETNEEEFLPYEKDEDFEYRIAQYINVDYSDYEDWGGHKEYEPNEY